MNALEAARTLLACALLCLSVAAQSIDQVVPGEGTLGDDVVITGSGFGDKPGKVVLVDPDGGKDARQAVVDWSDTEVVARIKRTHGPGPTMLRLTPKGSDDSASTGFTVLAPVIVGIDKTVVTPKEVVRITVQNLGTGRRTVDVGFKRARLTAVQKNEDGTTQLNIRIHRRNMASGTWNVAVTNKVGAAIAETVLQITTSKAKKVGGKRMKGTVDEAELRVPGGTVRSSMVDGLVLVEARGRRRDTGAKVEFELTIPVAPAVPTTFVGSGMDDALLVYREIVDDTVTEWTSAGGALALTTQGVVKKQQAGIVHATLTSGGAEPDVVLDLQFVARRP